MLQLQGTVLKYEPFTSKKGKELVSMIVFGENEQVYNVMGELKNVLNISKGEIVRLSVTALGGRNEVLLYVQEVLDNEISDAS